MRSLLLPLGGKANSAVQSRLFYIGPMNTFAHWKLFFTMLTESNRMKLNAR